MRTPMVCTATNVLLACTPAVFWRFNNLPIGRVSQITAWGGVAPVPDAQLDLSHYEATRALTRSA